VPQPTSGKPAAQQQNKQDKNYIKRRKKEKAASHPIFR
jgi:hypothetical protein